MADQQERAPRILVVDDNASLCRLVATILRVEGFEPFIVTNPEEAVPRALELRPDLILLDVMMPRLDGLKVCRRLRSLQETRYTPVILVTAKVSPADKVTGLRAGADDYLTKPFDNNELVERVRTALRRSADMKGLNPLTGLPGNEQIRAELRRRLGSGTATALLHVDLDNFKAFNDHYGFLRGDDGIAVLADCLKRTVPGVGDGFVGHIGGDDFALIVRPDRAERTAAEIIMYWNQRVRDLYDPEDLARGYIEVLDRQRNVTRFPLLTLSIGIASDDSRAFSSELEMADIAAEMKEQAKVETGSTWMMDRRHESRGEPPVAAAEEHEILLVVDDEADVRAMVRAALEDRYEILEARDGIEAYIVASNRHPHWVLLDYMMPELTGRFAAELIREEVPEAHIIAFSAALDERPEWADDLILKGVPLAAAFDRVVRRERGSFPPPRGGGTPKEEPMRRILRDRYIRKTPSTPASETPLDRQEHPLP